MARIVVGIDGSEASLRALAVACELGRATHRSVVALTAWRLPIVSTPYPIAVERDDFEQPARDILERAVDNIGDQGVEIEPVLVADDARSALLAHVGPDDMLVVGRRGHSGIVGLIMGSVASYCAAHAPCTVVIVPAEASADASQPA